MSLLFSVELPQSAAHSTGSLTILHAFKQMSPSEAVLLLSLCGFDAVLADRPGSSAGSKLEVIAAVSSQLGASLAALLDCEWDEVQVEAADIAGFSRIALENRFSASFIGAGFSPMGDAWIDSEALGKAVSSGEGMLADGFSASIGPSSFSVLPFVARLLPLVKEEEKQSSVAKTSLQHAIVLPSLASCLVERFPPRTSSTAALVLKIHPRDALSLKGREGGLVEVLLRRGKVKTVAMPGTAGGSKSSSTATGVAASAPLYRHIVSAAPEDGFLEEVSSRLALMAGQRGAASEKKPLELVRAIFPALQLRASLLGPHCTCGGAADDGFALLQSSALFPGSMLVTSAASGPHSSSSSSSSQSTITKAVTLAGSTSSASYSLLPSSLLLSGIALVRSGTRAKGQSIVDRLTCKLFRGGEGGTMPLPSLCQLQILSNQLDEEAIRHHVTSTVGAFLPLSFSWLVAKGDAAMRVSIPLKKTPLLSFSTGNREAPAVAQPLPQAALASALATTSLTGLASAASTMPPSFMPLTSASSLILGSSSKPAGKKFAAFTPKHGSQESNALLSSLPSSLLSSAGLQPKVSFVFPKEEQDTGLPAPPSHPLVRWLREADALSSPPAVHRVISAQETIARLSLFQRADSLSASPVAIVNSSGSCGGSLKAGAAELWRLIAGSKGSTVSTPVTRLLSQPDLAPSSSSFSSSSSSSSSCSSSLSSSSIYPDILFRDEDAADATRALLSKRATAVASLVNAGRADIDVGGVLEGADEAVLSRLGRVLSEAGALVSRGSVLARFVKEAGAVEGTAADKEPAALAGKKRKRPVDSEEQTLLAEEDGDEDGEAGDSKNENLSAVKRGKAGGAATAGGAVQGTEADASSMIAVVNSCGNDASLLAKLADIKALKAWLRACKEKVTGTKKELVERVILTVNNKKAAVAAQA